MLLRLARQVAGGGIENVHSIQTVNRTKSTRSYRLGVSGIDGLSLAARDVTVAPAAIAAIVASVRVRDAALAVAGAVGAGAVRRERSGLGRRRRPCAGGAAREINLPRAALNTDAPAAGRRSRAKPARLARLTTYAKLPMRVTLGTAGTPGTAATLAA